MSHMSLVKTRIRGGVWEGVLTVASPTQAPPQLTVTHRGSVLRPPELAADPDRPGTWTVRVAIPADLLADGIQTFLIHEPGAEKALVEFAVIVGDADMDDLRAEMDLIRAELDLLKRAFRRHCAETE